jgi:hypothetical protein
MNTFSLSFSFSPLTFVTALILNETAGEGNRTLVLLGLSPTQKEDFLTLLVLPRYLKLNPNPPHVFDFPSEPRVNFEVAACSSMANRCL